MLLIHTAILLFSSVLSVTAECTTGNPLCGIYTNPSDCPAIKADACNDSEIVTPCEEMGPPPKGKVCCQDLCKRGGFYDVLLIDTACFTVKCSAGYVCLRGECVKLDILPYDPCMFMKCARGYVCIQGRCVRSCPSVIKARPIDCDLILRPILPINACDTCLLDEECCYDYCGYLTCVKIPDPIGEGVYPICPDIVRSVATAEKICNINVTKSKTCEETGCSLSQSCCVNPCGPLGCVEKFGYCPSYNPRLQCRLSYIPARCDVTRCPPGTKCCVANCGIPECIDESVETIPCQPTWPKCEKTCGLNAFCDYRHRPCDSPKCACEDPYTNEDEVACKKLGPGCDGYSCNADEVCCTLTCNEPQCVKR